MKELKSKAKQLPIEEVKLSAMKYDQLQKQKVDLIKPKEDILHKRRNTRRKTKKLKIKEKNY